MNPDCDGHLLIVQHGPGRGRLHGFRRHLLEHFARTAPALSRRLRVHETGTGTPDLGGVRAVLFWLADPLRELYPDCHAEAEAIAAGVRARGGTVLNDPAALSHTIKSRQARIWREAGIPCARAEAFADAGALRGAVERVGLPAIVRADLHHAQEDTYTCRAMDEVAALPAEGRLYPGVALAMVDTRAAYQEERPGTIWAKWWHKKRIFVFGDVVVPNHCLFGTTPVVGLQLSPFWRYRRRHAILAPLIAFRPWEREAVAVDRAYAEAAPERPELFIRATRALGLDWVAIDYSTLADGSVILWEANPYFTMPVGVKGLLGRTRRLGPRVDRLCAGMVRHLEGVLGG
ncbi:MAG TPA: hypothetical protein VJ773_02065 [Gemmatimonadales bacterium]|nr:hypothetical protein [Gemmatimonadales bacterium]